MNTTKTRRTALQMITLCLVASLALGQNKPSASKSAPPSPVTINMPAGITQQQADAILQELREIHKLLEKQQTAVAAPQPTAAPAAPTKVSMQVASGWYSMGSADAPLTLVEFADYQCPFCKRFQSDTFVQLKKNYIDTGRLRFVSRDLPLDFHPHSLKAAQAARCAGEQGKFWEMREALISHSDDLAQESIVKYAQGLLLDMNGFRSCFDSDKYKPELQKEVAAAGILSISGTPTFILGRVAKNTLDGQLIVGAMPYSVFESEIKKSLGTN